MREISCNRVIFVISVLFLVGGIFLSPTEHQQVEIKAQGEPSFIVLNSSSTGVDGNNTGALSNDSTTDKKMEIQICDASHPC